MKWNNNNNDDNDGKNRKTYFGYRTVKVLFDYFSQTRFDSKYDK